VIHSLTKRHLARGGGQFHKVVWDSQCLSIMSNQTVPLPKDHRFFKKQTRRFFHDKSRPGEFVVADGRISERYIPEDENGPALFTNVHSDGDVEDLEMQEVESAVHAFAKNLKVPPEAQNLPYQGTDEGEDLAENISETELDDTDVSDTEWPTNLIAGSFSEDKRFYCSGEDESFYKIAKANDLDWKRLLNSHKQFYPPHLRQHSKLQAGTLIDFFLYNRYDETKMAAKKKRQVERERKDEARRKREEKPRREAGPKPSDRGGEENKRRSSTAFRSRKQRHAPQRSSSRSRASVTYAEWNSDDDLVGIAASADDDEKGNGKKRPTRTLSRQKRKVSPKFSGVETVSKRQKKGGNKTPSVASDYLASSDASESENSAEGDDSFEDSSEMDSDSSAESVDETPIIHVDLVLGIEERTLRDWDRKLKDKMTTHLTRGSIFRQDPRIYRDGEDEEKEERYLIKWKGYSYLHASWETLSDIHAMCSAASAAKVDRFLENINSDSSPNILFPSAERIIAVDKRDKWFDTSNPPCEYCGGIDEDAELNPALLCDGCVFGCSHVKCLELESVPNDDWFCQVCQAKQQLEAKGDNVPPVLAYNDKMFLVKWDGLPYAESTWESSQDIADNQLIEEFFRRERFPRTFFAKKPGFNNQQAMDQIDREVFKNENKLRSYQREGCKWMVWNFMEGRNSLLADEMGLGKTVQSVSFCKHLRDHQGAHLPFLIVAPLSTIPHWQREFLAWTDMNVLVLHGDPDSRELIFKHEWRFTDPNNPRKKLGRTNDYKFDVIITTYEGVNTCYDRLKRVAWASLIVDEAHRLKNTKSKLMQQLVQFKFQSTVLLTGTPIQNSMSELWSLLNFVAPGGFETIESFSAKYGKMATAQELDALHGEIEKYFLRRLKGDVEKIPPREETLIEVELTVEQKKYYRAIYEQNRHFLYKGLANTSKPSLMNISMELRKCCNHPFLIRGAEGVMMQQAEEGVTVEELLVRASGKCVLLDKLLPKLKAEGHRVLIFSQMVRMLDIISDYLVSRGFLHEMIDGRQRGNERQAAIDRFTTNPDILVMLLSTRAGGVGINLTAADTVIIFDSDWNPQNDIQAMARCHRIGQTKSVQVYRLLSANTYEMEMFKAASKKLGLDQAVLHKMEEDGANQAAEAAKEASGMGADDFKLSDEHIITSKRAKLGIVEHTKGNKKENLTEKSLGKKDVENLLKHGAYNLFQDGGDERSKTFCEADIDEILKTSSRRINVSGDASGDGSGAVGSMGSTGSKFSRASFVSEGSKNVDMDDPDFWKKMIGLADPREEERAALAAGTRKRRRFAGSYKEANDFRAWMIEGGSEYELDQTDEEGNDAEVTAGTRRLAASHWYNVVQDRLMAYGWGSWRAISAGLVDKSSPASNEKAGSTISPNPDNALTMDDIHHACLSWIAIWAMKIVTAPARVRRPRVKKPKQDVSVEENASLSKTLNQATEILTENDNPQQAEIPAVSSEKDGIVVDKQKESDNSGEEDEEDEILNKLNAWLPNDALDASKSVAYILGSNEIALRSIVRKSKVAIKTLESDMKCPTSHLSQWLNNTLSRFSTSKLVPKIYKWIAKGDGVEGEATRWRVRAELRRSKMTIVALSQTIECDLQTLFKWLYDRVPSLGDELEWSRKEFESSLVTLMNRRGDSNSTLIPDFCSRVLDDWAKKSSSEGSATPALIPVPGDMKSGVFLVDISKTMAQKCISRVANFLVLEEIAVDKKFFEENPRATSTLWSWVPRPGKNVKPPTEGWAVKHDMALLHMVMDRGMTKATCETLRDYFQGAGNLEQDYFSLCQALDTASPKSEPPHPLGIHVSWSSWKKRYRQLCNAFTLEKQKRVTKLNHRRKNAEKNHVQEERSFVKKILEKKRSSRVMMPKWLCVSCATACDAGDVRCGGCGREREGQPFLADMDIVVSMDQSLIHAGKMFSVKRDTNTNLIRVTSIDDMRCHKNIFVGDVILKIGDEHVIRNKWSAEKAQSVLNECRSGRIIFGRTLSYKYQVDIFKAGFKSWSNILPVVEKQLSLGKQKMAEYKNETKRLKILMNQLWPIFCRLKESTTGSSDGTGSTQSFPQH
jgi:superfamily II DNA or RNA helicase